MGFSKNPILDPWDDLERQQSSPPQQTSVKNFTPCQRRELTRRAHKRATLAYVGYVYDTPCGTSCNGRKAKCIHHSAKMTVVVGEMSYIM